MSALELKVYDIFKSRFSEQEASVVIEYVEEMVKDKIEDKALYTQAFQSKDLELLRKEMGEKFAETNLKIAECTTKIAESKTETLRWTFGIFFAIMMAIVGLYLKK
jgi:hypothetical protein